MSAENGATLDNLDMELQRTLFRGSKIIWYGRLSSDQSQGFAADKQAGSPDTGLAAEF